MNKIKTRAVIARCGSVWSDFNNMLRRTCVNDCLRNCLKSDLSSARIQSGHITTSTTALQATLGKTFSQIRELMLHQDVKTYLWKCRNNVLVSTLMGSQKKQKTFQKHQFSNFIHECRSANSQPQVTIMICCLARPSMEIQITHYAARWWAARCIAMRFGGYVHSVFE